MSYNIIPTPDFERELKVLFKKYASIKNDISDLIKDLLIEPQIGKALGNNCYKIRMSIKSKNKGKSGGARIITYVQVVDETIYLLSIYDKSSTDTISNSEILNRIKNI